MTRARLPLPLPWLLFTSALALAFVLAPSLCHGNVIAPPLVAPPTTAPFTPAAPLSAARTAYVAIHFEDHDTSQLSSHDSEASLQGIRVMMASVADPKRGASTRDRVVLVPAHTSAESRRQFAADGLIVLDMDASLPHNDICAPKFDRIYLWADVLAQRYDRVIYLDWDVVVQRPMDQLFLCGHHCMVFNSILHFVDGIMVVKPDGKVFGEMVERYKRERLSSAWSGRKEVAVPASGGSSVAAAYPWRTPSKTMCWEKSYLFFLFWFGNIEARLDASSQLNAMMWYEKYSWTLMRGKEYRNMTNDQEVPALSLGYTTLKPFHWAPSLFFNLGWDWSDIRDEYLGIHHWWFICTRVLLLLALLVFAVKGLRVSMLSMYRSRPSSGAAAKLMAVLRAAHMKVLGPTDGFVKGVDGDEDQYYATSVLSLSGYWLPQYGSDVLGVVIGGAHAFLLAYFLTAYTALIPMLTAPHPAWRLWFCFHTLGVYMFNHWLFLSYHAAPALVPAALHAPTGEMRPVAAGAGPDASPRSSSGSSSSWLSRGYPILSSTAWLAGWELFLYVMMRRTFYPEFVVKMFVLFPLLAAMLIAAINMNRAVWRSVEAAQAAAKGMHSTAASPNDADVHAPMLPGGGRR